MFGYSGGVILTPHTFIEDPAWTGQCRECRQHRKHVLHKVASATALSRSTRQVLEESGEYARAASYGVRLGG